MKTVLCLPYLLILARSKSLTPSSSRSAQMTWRDLDSCFVLVFITIRSHHVHGQVDIFIVVLSSGGLALIFVHSLSRFQKLLTRIFIINLDNILAKKAGFSLAA